MMRRIHMDLILADHLPGARDGLQNVVVPAGRRRPSGRGLVPIRPVAGVRADSWDGFVLRTWLGPHRRRPSEGLRDTPRITHLPPFWTDGLTEISGSAQKRPSLWDMSPWRIRQRCARPPGP